MRAHPARDDQQPVVRRAPALRVDKRILARLHELLVEAWTRTAPMRVLKAYVGTIGPLPRSG